jgi:3-hydroxy-3-methylglutaryl CoA synthase
MVIDLALQAGLTEESLYFNVETVGNASSASIPLAIHDAVRDGVIKKPTRIFAPGFGAGAVAGYCVMRIDPAVVAISTDVSEGADASTSSRQPLHQPSPEATQLAFR